MVLLFVTCKTKLTISNSTFFFFVILMFVYKLEHWLTVAIQHHQASIVMTSLPVSPQSLVLHRSNSLYRLLMCFAVAQPSNVLVATFLCSDVRHHSIPRNASLLVCLTNGALQRSTPEGCMLGAFNRAFLTDFQSNL